MLVQRVKSHHQKLSQKENKLITSAYSYYRNGLSYRIAATSIKLNRRYVLYKKAAKAFHKASKLLSKVSSDLSTKYMGMQKEHEGYYYMVKAELHNNPSKKAKFFRLAHFAFSSASQSYGKVKARKLKKLNIGWSQLALAEYFLTLGLYVKHLKIKQRYFTNAARFFKNAYIIFSDLNIKKLKSRSKGLFLFSRGWLIAIRRTPDRFLIASHYLQKASNLFYLAEWKQFKSHVKGWSEWFRGCHYIMCGKRGKAIFHFKRCKHYFKDASFKEGIRLLNKTFKNLKIR
jgi:hypothetical protein